MRLALRRLSVGLPIALLAACASLVGIEDARLDPKLDSAAGASSGGASSGGQSNQTGGISGVTDAGQGGAGGDGGDPTLLLCERYCTAVMQNCTGPVQVYESPAVCLRACRALDPGTPGDRTGNTIACRLFHAKQIELIGDEVTECPAAGPGGDGVCGSNCEGYCTLLQDLCPPALGVECRATCPTIPDPGGYDSSKSSGLTLQCRLYHVSAATQVPDLHCPHAVGAGPCSK
jgi:hypothetical protein